MLFWFHAQKAGVGGAIAREIFILKAMEIAIDNLPSEKFKGSLGLCGQTMKRHSTALHYGINISQRLLNDCTRYLATFQVHGIKWGKQKRHNCILEEMGNTVQTSLYFVILMIR